MNGGFIAVTFCSLTWHRPNALFIHSPLLDDGLEVSHWIDIYELSNCLTSLFICRYMAISLYYIYWWRHHVVFMSLFHTAIVYDVIVCATGLCVTCAMYRSLPLPLSMATLCVLLACVWRVLCVAISHSQVFMRPHLYCCCDRVIVYDRFGFHRDFVDEFLGNLGFHYHPYTGILHRSHNSILFINSVAHRLSCA